MTKKTTDSAAQNKTPPPAIGLVLELEFILFSGRRLLFEAYGSVLKKHQTSLAPLLFARCCLKRNIEKGLQALLAALDKKGLPEAETAAAIHAQFESSLKSSSNLPAPEPLALLQKAIEHKIKIGLLSYLPQETADLLAARLTLNQPACLRVIQKAAADLPTPDGWLSLLKAMEVTPRSSVALVDCAQACRSALAVGMRCVVIPDSFTNWQDFSGADFVLGQLPELKINDIFTLMSPAHYRKRPK